LKDIILFMFCLKIADCLTKMFEKICLTKIVWQKLFDENLLNATPALVVCALYFETCAWTILHGGRESFYPGLKFRSLTFGFQPGFFV
jgi:hypothetical protein